MSLRKISYQKLRGDFKRNETIRTCIIRVDKISNTDNRDRLILGTSRRGDPRKRDLKVSVTEQESI